MARVRGLVRSLGLPPLVLVLVAAQGCMLLIPVMIIRYMRTSDSYTATATIPVEARRVYDTAVQMAEEKDLQITTRDDAGLHIEVTDGRQKASLKAVPRANRSCDVTVTADIPKGRDEHAMEKELALRIITKVCDRLGVSYRVK